MYECMGEILRPSIDCKYIHCHNNICLQDLRPRQSCYIRAPSHEHWNVPFHWAFDCLFKTYIQANSFSIITLFITGSLCWVSNGNRSISPHKGPVIHECMLLRYGVTVNIYINTRWFTPDQNITFPRIHNKSNRGNFARNHRISVDPYGAVYLYNWPPMKCL